MDIFSYLALKGIKISHRWVIIRVWKYTNTYIGILAPDNLWSHMVLWFYTPDSLTISFKELTTISAKDFTHSPIALSHIGSSYPWNLITISFKELTTISAKDFYSFTLSLVWLYLSSSSFLHHCEYNRLHMIQFWNTEENWILSQIHVQLWLLPHQHTN